MLYDLSMSESRVFVIQEIAGTKAGNPKINIMGAAAYSTSGKFNFLLPEFSQMIFSPGPLVYLTDLSSSPPLLLPISLPTVLIYQRLLDKMLYL